MEYWGIVLFGGLHDGERSIMQEVVIKIEELESNRDGFGSAWIGEPGGYPRPIRLGGSLGSECRQMILPGGVLDRGEQFGALVKQGQTPPPAITRGAHSSGIPLGHGQHAATEEAGTLLCIERIVFAFAPRNSFHREDVLADKGEMVLGTEISEPIPGAQAFYGHDTILSIGGKGL